MKQYLFTFYKNWYQVTYLFINQEEFEIIKKFLQEETT